MRCALNGLELHYQVYGEGRPILFLHGLGIDHRSLSAFAEPAFRRREGWQRIYLDLPGMGQSDSAPWAANSDRMLEIVSDFIDAVIPERSFLVAGYSYGGYLARGLVKWRGEDVEGLFLLCPVIFAERERRTVAPHTTLVRDRAFLSTLDATQMEEFQSVAVIQDRRTWLKTEREILAGCKVADREFIERLSGEGYPFSFDPADLHAPYSGPALIVTGRQDSVVGNSDAWRMMENYPRATFAVLDSAGHNLQIEREGLLGRLMGDWLDRVCTEEVAAAC